LPEKSGDVALQFVLQNSCQSPISFCDPKQLACTTSYKDRDGNVVGTLLGWPDPHACEPTRITRLKSEQKLTGTASVSIFPTVSGTISVRCEYMCTGGGSEFGQPVWKGSVRSNWLEYAVPKIMACE
jgi:hypothetical protein